MKRFFYKYMPELLAILIFALVIGGAIGSTMYLTRPAAAEFSYKQRVNIKSGFYKGNTAEIQNIYEASKDCSFFGKRQVDYGVQFRVDNRILTVIVSGCDLQEIK